jgi:hypothetical protein
VRLDGAAGEAITLSVVGYQFPDAENPEKRYSWHMVEGEVDSADGRWHLSFPALTCDETPMVAEWLVQVADWAENGCAGPAPECYEFTEPNLRFQVAADTPGNVTLGVALNLEFRPPWMQPARVFGTPYVLRLRLNPRALRVAAAEWQQEAARYPDRSPNRNAT